MSKRSLYLLFFILLVVLNSGVLAQNRRVVGLLPFQNMGDPRTDWVSRGVDELLRDKLLAIESLIIYEQSTLDRFLVKEGIRKVSDVDAKKAFAIGKATGIEVLFLGDYQVEQSHISLNLRLVSTYTGSNIYSNKFEGSLPEMFTFFERVVLRGLDVMQIRLSPEERQEIARAPTSSLQAFESYCRAYVEIDKDSPMEIIAGYFQRAIQADPDFWEARYNLGVIYYNFHLYRKALQEFDRVSQGNPNFYKPYYGRGVIKYLQREYREALTQLKASLRRFPDHDRSYFYLGMVYMELDSLKKGIQALERSIELNPNYPPAYYQLGLADMKRGWFKKAISSLTRAARLNPDYYLSNNALGEAYYALNLYEEAIIEFRKAIKLKPNFATAYFNLGNAIYRRGALAEIVDAFWALIEVQYVAVGSDGQLGGPMQDLQGLRDKSRIRDSSKILKEMVNAYRTALQYDDRFYEASYNLALTYENLGKVDSAEFFYKLAIKQKPDLAQAHMRLGKIYEQRHEYQSALDQFKTVVSIEPAYFAENPKLGEKYRYLNIIETVLNENIALLEAQPDNAAALLTIGKIYLSLGRYGQAEHYYEQLVQMKPSNRLAKRTLDQIRRRLRKL